MAFLSVIIPLYNKSQYIARTIQSVLEQSFQDFEIIVVNDGSTDNSLKVVNSINDRRIRIIDKRNEGVSITRNRGAYEANCDLLFFLDADDTILPNCLEILKKLREDFPDADLWSANYLKRRNTLETKAIADFHRGYVNDISKMYWQRKWAVRMGSFICTKQSFLDCGGFPENICIYEDLLLLCRFIERKKCVYDPTIVMCYDIDNRGLSIAKVPLEKRAEGNLDFDNKDTYIRLKYGELLGIYIISSIKRFRFGNICKVLRKYGKYTIFSIYSLLRRVFR